MLFRHVGHFFCALTAACTQLLQKTCLKLEQNCKLVSFLEPRRSAKRQTKTHPQEVDVISLMVSRQTGHLMETAVDTPALVGAAIWGDFPSSFLRFAGGVGEFMMMKASSVLASFGSEVRSTTSFETNTNICLVFCSPAMKCTTALEQHELAISTIRSCHHFEQYERIQNGSCHKI